MTSKQQALFLARCAIDKKAEKVVVIDLKGTSGLADFFVICSAASERGVKAIFDHIEKTLKEKKIRITDREGLSKKTWVLLGTGDVVVHIFHHKERDFYNLEGLWVDSPRISVEPGSDGPS